MLDAAACVRYLWTLDDAASCSIDPEPVNNGFVNDWVPPTRLPTDDVAHHSSKQPLRGHLVPNDLAIASIHCRSLKKSWARAAARKNITAYN